MSHLRVACAILLAICCLRAQAAGGPLGIDHRLNKEEQGIWAREIQLALHYGLIGTAFAGAVIEGSETRLGLTFWHAFEAGGITSVESQALKRLFWRPRPSQVNDPNLWFQAGRYQSFPSGEVSLAAAVATPFIIEYAADYPAIWALAAISAYVGVARVRSQAHWQSDVLGAMVLGAANGYFASQPSRPLILQLTGDGVFIGLRYRW